jgi:putative inorganic carbon (hco3(-)) transporter
MRDIAITLIVFGSLLFTLRRPYIGVLMWCWISVMNPHRLSYGFAYSFPFAAVIAAVTLVSLLTTKDPKKLPLTPIMLTLFAFLAWMGLTTIFAINFDNSLEMLNRVSKTMLMTAVLVMLIKTKEQIRMLVWVLVLSIGYYGTKGGIFTVLTGGNSIVWGPEGSYIEGNNEVALAFITIIPVIAYLVMTEKNKWVKRALSLSIMLCAIASIGSYSRGALVGIAAMLFFLWLKSPRKALTGAVLIMLIPFALVFMPEKWTSRMETINTYQQDASAMGRINAWYFAFNMAKERPLGGGYDVWTTALFKIYAPDPDDPHAAHSIYFQALGEHGFIGLGIYLLLAFLTFKKAMWIVRNTEKRDDLKWAAQLATMIQVSMIGFGVGGAFLSLLYYDVPYYLMGIVVVLGELVAGQLKQESAALQSGRQVALDAV